MGSVRTHECCNCVAVDSFVQMSTECAAFAHSPPHSLTFPAQCVHSLFDAGAQHQLRRKTKQQLRVLRKKTAAGLLPSSSKVLQISPSVTATAGTPTSSLSEQEQERQRRQGDRLGGIPGAMKSMRCSIGEKHLSAIEANGIDSAAPKDALAAELWAWLGGGGGGREGGAKLSTKSSAAKVGGGEQGGRRDAAARGGGGEWRGAFTNREFWIRLECLTRRFSCIRCRRYSTT